MDIVALSSVYTSLKSFNHVCMVHKCVVLKVQETFQINFKTVRNLHTLA